MYMLIALLPFIAIAMNAGESIFDIDLFGHKPIFSTEFINTVVLAVEQTCTIDTREFEKFRQEATISVIERIQAAEKATLSTNTPTLQINKLNEIKNFFINPKNVPTAFLPDHTTKESLLLYFLQWVAAELKIESSELDPTTYFVQITYYNNHTAHVSQPCATLIRKHLNLQADFSEKKLVATVNAYNEALKQQ